MRPEAVVDEATVSGQKRTLKPHAGGPFVRKPLFCAVLRGIRVRPDAQPNVAQPPGWKSVQLCRVHDIAALSVTDELA
jgi:hypothetical protein